MIDYNPAYYNEDSQVGESCFLDGKNAYIDFNADLKTFLVSPGDLTTDYSIAAGCSDFNLFQFEAKPMELLMEFYVGGSSYEATQTNISNLFLAAKQCVIRKEGDIFEYAAVLVERSSEDTEVEPYYLVICRFAVIRRKPMVERKLNQSSVIYNEGNTPSGMRIVIDPERVMETFTVADVTISDLAPGITYIIDGISGRVTANGVNYFAHTNIIDFPKIKPGKNEIKMSEDIPIVVSFYPVFS